jgi:hypothetical protein
MDNRQMSGKPTDTDVTGQAARRDLRKAWICVVLVPIGFVVAMLLGEGTLDLLGYPAGGDRVPAMWVEGMIGIPVTMIGILPGASAAVFGMRARRGGLGRGLVPAIIGALFVLYWIFKTVAGLLRFVF